MDCCGRESGESAEKTRVETLDMSVSSERAIRRPPSERLKQRIWEFARGIFCYTTPWFATGWRRLITTIFAGLCSGNGRLAKSVSLARTARLDYPWRISVGRDSSIGERSWLQAQDEIVIGERVCIGEDVRIITGSHDIASSNFDLETDGIRIGNDVWIATGSTILKGVSIGEGAVVAAGSVVTKDVDPWTVIGGNPAKFIKKRVLKE